LVTKVEEVHEMGSKRSPVGSKKAYKLVVTPYLEQSDPGAEPTLPTWMTAGVPTLSSSMDLSPDPWLKPLEQNITFVEFEVV